MSCRRRPLHSCAVSFLAIARKAYTKTQDFNGPLGIMIKKIVRLASAVSLLVYALQYEYQLLAILSFVDDRIILVLEDKVEAIFPLSKFAFHMIDELVQIIETLPAKFDFALKEFPMMIHKVPFLDLLLAFAISWLNFWLSILTHWGSETAKEKEIVVDSSSEPQSVGEAGNDIIVSQNRDDNDIQEDFSPISSISGYEAAESGSKDTYKDALERVMRPTYKDALKNGSKENIQNKDKSAQEETNKSSASMDGTAEVGNQFANQTQASIMEEDPILALFESAWHMKP